MRMVRYIGILCSLIICDLAQAQAWECKNKVTGRSTITNAPAQNENLTCLVVNNDRVAFNKLDPLFMEGYIKEAEEARDQLLGLRTSPENGQEEAATKKTKTKRHQNNDNESDILLNSKTGF